MTDAFHIQHVRDIAHLARLDLSSERLAEFGRQLSRVVGYFDLLQELDTSGVEPTAHPLELTNVMRDDVPHQSVQTEQALANAPDHDDIYFRVPQVLDQTDA